MTGGPSGLRPIEVLADRAKCPDSPSKRRYRTSAEAVEAAEKRTRETRLAIVAYACAGCGSYHLTKKRGGSDELIPGETITTRALQAKAPNHPVFAAVRDESVLPIVPGNGDARRRMLALYLTEHHNPSTAELLEAIGVGRDTLRQDMRQLGWAVPRGPGARWAKIESPSEPAEMIEPVRPDIPTRFFDTERVRHIPMGDVLDVLYAAGFTLRIEVEE